MNKRLRIIHTTDWSTRSGTWDGPPGAFQRMEAVVRVEAVLAHQADCREFTLRDLHEDMLNSSPSCDECHAIQ